MRFPELMKHDSQEKKAKQLTTDLFYNLFARIKECGNTKYYFEDQRAIPLSEIFKNVYKQARLMNNLVPNRLEILNTYKCFKCIERFFGISYISRSADLFIKFFKEHSLKDLMKQEQFRYRIRYDFKEYRDVSDEWLEWINNFSNRMLIDPLSFMTELEEFEKVVKPFLRWSGNRGNFHVQDQVDSIKKFIKGIINE